MSQEIMQQIQHYLRNEGNNIHLADGLLLEKRYFHGPVAFKVIHLSRCCGPEASMQYRTNAADFTTRVNGIIERIHAGWEMPPVLVNYCDGHLSISDGNHRHEAYTRMNKERIPVLFWMTGKDTYKEFLEKFEYMPETTECHEHQNTNT